MRKITCSLLILLSVLSYSPQASAQCCQPVIDTLQLIKTYIENGASFYGIDVTKNNPPKPKTPELQYMQNITANLLNSFLPPIPGTSGGQQQSKKLGTSLTHVFGQSGFAPYSSAVDVQPFAKQDPTLQAIINTLFIPSNRKNCFMENGKPSCKLDSNWVRAQAALNPALKNYYSNYIANVKEGRKKPKIDPYNLNMLNANALMGPLQYSLKAFPNAHKEGISAGASNIPTIRSGNQYINALNFVRYSSGQFMPVDLPNKFDIASIVIQSTPKKGDTTAQAQQRLAASAQLYTYLANLYSFTAMSSIGISNFNFIAARRVPQENSPQKKSVAEMECEMASWRLVGGKDGLSRSPCDNKPIKLGENNQNWHALMEKAQPIVVQREMAYLLAELNYQLYKQREVQERILATNSAFQEQALITIRSGYLTLGSSGSNVGKPAATASTTHAAG